MILTTLRQTILFVLLVCKYESDYKCAVMGMIGKRSDFERGNPDAITIFSPGDRAGYYNLLWGNPDAITMFNPGSPEGYRDLLWQGPQAISVASAVSVLAESEREADEPQLELQPAP